MQPGHSGNNLMPVNPADEQAALQPYLLAGEKILWTGRPDRSRMFASGDAFLIPFSLMWGGFALFWEAGVLGLFGGGQPAPGFFALWGVPFVVLGQYFIWGRFVYKRWDRARTVYGVTSERVLVLRRGSLQSLFVNQLPTLSQHVRSDGSGSLEFNNVPFGYGMWANTGMEWFARRGVPLAFYDIPDAARVYRLVADARKGAS
jgi:hypothetical protein